MNTATMQKKLINLLTGFSRPAFVQTAALCLRKIDGESQVMLVRSMTRKNWIIPKGWPMKGKTLAEAAQIEAWEEAGVKGVIDPAALGRFTYTKIRKSGLPVQCSAEVFRLDVKKVSDDFPEARKRERLWVPLAVAAEKASLPDLRVFLATVAEDLG